MIPFRAAVQTGSLDVTAADLDGDLVLRSTGKAWEGTFSVLLRALLDDLLPEGPVNAVIAYETDLGCISEVTVSGRLASFDASGGEADTCLVMDDGFRIPFEDVRAIAI